MYQYPDQKPQETLDRVNPLFRADGRQTPQYTTSNQTVKNVNPDPVTNGAYPLPGSQLFAVSNMWREAPQPVDIVQREIPQPVLDSTLVYRSGYQAPRRESRNIRLNTPTVTANGINSARFDYGPSGDVYGR